MKSLIQHENIYIDIPDAIEWWGGGGGGERENNKTNSKKQNSKSQVKTSSLKLVTIIVH